MDRQKRRVHLVARGCSGRAVTIQNLLPAEKDAALLNAAKSLGPEASRTELGVASTREGVKMMILEVTQDVGFKNDFRVDPATKWTKVSLADLDAPSGPLSYDGLFTAKDDAILSAIFSANNDPTRAEVEAIANDAIPLAE